MDASSVGLIGGLIGGIIGVIGGVIGTYFSIKNTKNSKERAVAIKFSVIIWIVMIVLTGVSLLLPNQYKMFAFFPFWLALPFVIIAWNKKQQEAREE
jgi:glucose-6-phosphate-specific signal transduction histidine kinase